MKPVLSHLPNQPHSLPPKLAVLLPPCKYIACTSCNLTSGEPPTYICQASNAVIPCPVHPHWLSMQKFMVRPCTAQGLIYLRYLFPVLQSRAGDAADRNDLAPQQCQFSEALRCKRRKVVQQGASKSSDTCRCQHTKIPIRRCSPGCWSPSPCT